MSSFFRFCAVALALLLALAGIAEQRYEARYSPQSPQLHTGPPATAGLVEKKLNDVWGIQQQVVVVSSVHILPAPVSKFSSTDCVAGVIATAISGWRIASAYLVLAREISPGLSVPALIFPFHYFW